MSANLREAIEAAVDSQPEGGGGAPATTSPEPSGPATTVESSGTAVQSSTGTPPPTQVATNQPRDTSGKFAPKDREEITKPAPKVGAAPAATAAPGATAVPEPTKAPRSWSPGLREMWNGLPADVQREVLKRERETGEALKDAAKHRETGESWQKVIAPFEPIIRQQGGEPTQVVRNMLHVAAVMNGGAPVPKAQLLAQMVMHFGVPVELLDAALSTAMRGGATPPGVAQHGGMGMNPDAIERIVQAAVDQRLAPLRQAAQQRQTVMQSQVDHEVDDFADKHEFFEDLREDMADVIDLAAKRGLEVSLDEAYSRAAAMHPEISKVLSQRAGSTAPAAKRAASVQVTGAPNAGGTQAPNTLRGAIEAAIETASGR